MATSIQRGLEPSTGTGLAIRGTAPVTKCSDLEFSIFLNHMELRDIGEAVLRVSGHEISSVLALGHISLQYPQTKEP